MDSVKEDEPEDDDDSDGEYRNIAFLKWLNAGRVEAIKFK